MIDNLSLALCHGLMILAAWRLMWRPDLDVESGQLRDPWSSLRKPPQGNDKDA